MKIMCQEHYDKVVQYAESIGDKTFQECLVFMYFEHFFHGGGTAVE